MRNGNNKKGLDYTFYLVFDVKSRMHNFINERQQLRLHLMAGRPITKKWRVTHRVGVHTLPDSLVSILTLELRFKSDPAALTIYFVQSETHYPVHLMLTALL